MRALLDSGAMGLFMSRRLAEKKGFKFREVGKTAESKKHKW